MSFNNLNPPPNPPPLISGSVNLNSCSVASSGFSGSWPTYVYPLTVTESQSIDFSKNMFTYIKMFTDSLIILSISFVPVGTIVVVETQGTGNHQVIMDGISSTILSSGTYLIAKFNGTVKSSELTNPTAI
jgi:hypothetical protein